MKARVLIVEDDPHSRELLASLLKEEGYTVEAVASAAEALDRLTETPCEAVLLDVRLPDRNGMSLLDDLLGLPDAPAVLVMTAYGSSDLAIEAIKKGAYDYLVKPLHFDEVLVQLERAIVDRKRRQELERVQAAMEEREAPALVGNSPAMQKVYKLIGQVAPTNSTVLIRGESGTGKELVARLIHQHSPRARKPFVVVNCAAIPAELLEAELFGYERGAFTGATARKLGKFELADGGTLFLDEVGELPALLQAKLLRFLQEKTIERLGSTRPLDLDVRILAATHRDLESMVQAGTFREDLYFRLNVFTIHLPALRERREDIPELAQTLCRRLARKLGVPVPQLSPEALEELQRRPWRGNVRELENCLERALILSRGGPIYPQHLSPASEWGTIDPMDLLPLEEGFHQLVARLEKRLIERALAQAGGNRTRAAEILKIHRRLLYDKMRQYGIETSAGSEE